MQKILILIGTRPEAIKMAPIVAQFKKNPCFETIVLSTGQHRELVTNTLLSFDISIDLNLNVMISNQTLENLTSKLFNELSSSIESIKPDLVMGQGDTTTVFVASTVCFYKNIPFAHIEAGLRSSNIKSPFPEEFNRRVTSLTSTLHFAPSEDSVNNLRKEGVPQDSIFMVGNTVIDALKWMVAKKKPFSKSLPRDKKIILVTAHRRENFGEPHRAVFSSINKLSSLYPELFFVYPVHPNPKVKELAITILSNNKNVMLTDPLEYSDLVSLMSASYLIMTDSGGIQEEAPFLGKPVLILRNETERNEVISENMAVLVGTDEEKIVKTISKLIDDKNFYDSFVKFRSPYGDGLSSERIFEVIKKHLAPK